VQLPVRRVDDLSNALVSRAGGHADDACRRLACFHWARGRLASKSMERRWAVALGDLGAHVRGVRAGGAGRLHHDRRPRLRRHESARDGRALARRRPPRVRHADVGSLAAGLELARIATPETLILSKPARCRTASRVAGARATICSRTSTPGSIPASATPKGRWGSPCSSGSPTALRGRRTDVRAEA
jgi:hypothetical protein